MQAPSLAENLSAILPAVLIIGLLTDRTIILGLDTANSVLLCLSRPASFYEAARRRSRTECRRCAVSCRGRDVF